MTDLLQLKDGRLIDDPLAGVAPCYGPRSMFDQPRPHSFRRLDEITDELLHRARAAQAAGLNVRFVFRS